MSTVCANEDIFTSENQAEIVEKDRVKLLKVVTRLRGDISSYVVIVISYVSGVRPCCMLTRVQLNGG